MKIKILESVYIPKYATVGSAAIDLRACSIENNEQVVVLDPHHQITFGTGIALDLESELGPFRVAGLILPRSGLGTRGIILGNSVGLIDSDYRGEIKVCLWNRSFEEVVIRKYDRIAQLIFIPYFKPELEVVSEFEETERGESGFGSTGR